MKKNITFILVFMVGALYARTSPVIDKMNPQMRASLAESMFESADAYDQAGNKKKAKEYRLSALEVYPLGDKAYRMAQQLGITLDDEKTYTNLLVKAETAYTNKKYEEAVAGYLLALELRQPIEVYEKLQSAYEMIGDKENAQGLKEVIVIVKSDVTTIPPSDSAEETQEKYEENSEEFINPDYEIDPEYGVDPDEIINYE